MWKKAIYILLLNIFWKSLYVCICHVRGVNSVLCSSRTKKKYNCLLLLINNCTFGWEFWGFFAGYCKKMCVYNFLSKSCILKYLQYIFHYWSEWLNLYRIQIFIYNSNIHIVNFWKNSYGKNEHKVLTGKSGWDQDTNKMSSLELFTYLIANGRAFHYLTSAFSQYSATAENYQLL